MTALFNKKEEKKKKAPKEADVQHEELDTETVEQTSQALPKGGDPEAYRFVLSPHVTEKATNGNMLNKYTFKVSKEANKIEIKKAIERLYKVKVASVHVVNIPAKTRQIGRYMGTKIGFKKAIVTLKEGDKIEIA